jgi:hypothetical protein
LLSHRTRQIPAEPAQLVNAPSADIVFVDARTDLVGAKSLCKILGTTGLDVPLILIVTEGGLTAVSPDWGVDDVILVTAGPAEVDARVRLAIGRMAKEQVSTRIQTSGITIDESSYSAKVHGRPLDLTYKEFQLLHFFATHPSRVFTREQLMCTSDAFVPSSATWSSSSAPCATSGTASTSTRMTPRRRGSAPTPDDENCSRGSHVALTGWTHDRPRGSRHRARRRR